jgi:RHH-type proline utilization regulon transcriptional repressor/proline dehydrogenase/delta 1-pyrroline-5-carboxylate dehydrogenase
MERSRPTQAIPRGRPASHSRRSGSLCLDRAAENARERALPPFDAPYAEDDARSPHACSRRRLPRSARRVDATPQASSRHPRRPGGFGGVEQMLREYALSTKEGLALMVLAEALLRVPDSATADQLIEDKLGQGDFAGHEAKSDAFLVSASAWALGITRGSSSPGRRRRASWDSSPSGLGLPAVRTATRQAMRVMGNHFVLGQTIEEALKRAASAKGRIYRYSFDMLGEGARTADDARRYFQSYASAIDAIGRSAGNEPLPNRPGISVKLSALHPRYEATGRERVMRELVPGVRRAPRARPSVTTLNFTGRREEADRLELLARRDRSRARRFFARGGTGSGLAVQAYRSAPAAVIENLCGARGSASIAGSYVAASSRAPTGTRR